MHAVLWILDVKYMLGGGTQTWEHRAFHLFIVYLLSVCIHSV